MSIKKIYLGSFIFTAGMFLAGLAGSAAYAQTADYTRLFNTQLTGAEEVPPVTTETTGNASFRLADDRKTFEFTLNVFKGSNIMAGHLHCGEKSENGPVIVNLFGGQMNVDGQLVRATISEENILPAGAECSPRINSVARLAQAMRSGEVYVNVHSTQYPNGVVRGQLSEQRVDRQANRDIGLYATENPDGVANDAVVAIDGNLQDSGQDFTNFDGATSVQSVKLDDEGDAYTTFDAANNTGGVLLIDDIANNAGNENKRTLSGSNTGLVAPKGLELVASKNAVVIADFGAKKISVFADDAEGNVAPQFSVSNLGATARSVWDVDYDNESDTLFAAGTDGTVMVFDDFFRDKGTDGPTRLIIPADDQENKISVNLHGIVYVPERDSLIISDVGAANSASDGQVFTLNNVKQKSGRSAVELRLAGANTRLGNPVDIEYKDRNLYVAEKSNDALLQFNNILRLDGMLNQAADRSLQVTKPESLSVYSR